MPNSHVINQMRQILQQMEQAESRNAQLLQQLQQAEQQATQQTRQLQQLVSQIDVSLTAPQQVSPTYAYQGGTQFTSFGTNVPPVGTSSLYGSYSQPKGFGQQSGQTQFGQETFNYGGSQF